jgi:hypothetical protein
MPSAKQVPTMTIEIYKLMHCHTCGCSGPLDSELWMGGLSLTESTAVVGDFEIEYNFC